MRRFSRLLVISFVFGILATPAQSEPADAADPAAAEFIARINRTISQFSAGNAEGFCVSVINSFFDFDTLARTTSAGTWDQMNSQQKAAYRAAFLRRAGKDCALQASDSAGDPLTFVGMRIGEEGDRLIATQSRQRGRGRMLVWRARADSGRRLRAVDVIVDGRSMAIAARDDAKAILGRNNGGVDALIASLAQ